MLSTIESIAADIVENKLDEETKQVFATISAKEARQMHHGFGTWIRNTYGLWHNNPLTEVWRTKPETHDMRDGVDHSKDHPDNISNDIIEAVWKLLQK